MQMYNNKNPSFSEMLAIFKEPDATPTQIADVGEKSLMKLYGGTIELYNLENLKYRIFSTVVAKLKCQLARLPPTRDAAKYHSFRTSFHFLLYQMFTGKSRMNHDNDVDDDKDDENDVVGAATPNRSKIYVAWCTPAIIVFINYYVIICGDL